MISRTYYAIKANATLVSLLRRAGVDPNLAYPELLKTRHPDRQKRDNNAELDLVVRLYLRSFRRRLKDEGAPESLITSVDLDRSKFEEFWTITVFDDCEDVDDLLKDEDNNADAICP